MANVNINLNQYLNNNAYSQVGNNVPTEALNNSSAADVVNVLKSIATGEKITANILDMVGNQVTIGFGQDSITALLTGDVGVNIGDKVTFEVNNNSEQVVLKALDASSNSESAGIKLANNALNQAMVPINEKNTAIVMELVKNNMSISRDSLQEFSRLTKAFPDASAKTLVDLTKLGVPITQDNITQYENYQNYEHSISDKLPAIASEVISMLDNEADIPVLEKIINSENIPGDKTSAYLNENDLKELAGLTKDLKLADDIIKGNIKLSDALTKIINEHEKPSELSHGVVKKAISELIENRFLIKPEDLKQEGQIKDFYSKVLKESAEISKILTQAGKDGSALNEQMKDIRQNVSFMNDLNQAMAYVQLPLKFSNQNVHSDLFVYKDKRKPVDRENISALLHLDMDNLGSMDIYVKLTSGTNLTTKFMLEKEEMLDFIMEHIDQLDARLQALGYNTNISVTESDKSDKHENAVVDEIVGRREVPEIMRFRFDIKA